MLNRTPLYVRGIVARKPGLAEGRSIPRIERELGPMAPPPAHLAQIRALLRDTNEQFIPLTYPHVIAFEAHLQNMLDSRFPLLVCETR